MYKILSPSQSIPKAYLHYLPEHNEVSLFKQSMKGLLERINPAEHEEFNKNLVIKFFNSSIYRDRQYMVNTYNVTDLAIYSEMGTEYEHPVVLFEFKGPNRPDMVSKDDLKKKALYELILYYIREEFKNHNTDIKHLIVTNCWEFFVFEKKSFYQLFGRNKRFVQNVLDADTANNTEYIYNVIIKPEVEKVENRLQFTYIDIRKFERSIDNDDIINNKTFISTYKLFSPTNLLKQPFVSDHNRLNKNFYSELLYIMGVEEIIDNNGVHKIKRLKENKQSYTLVEQAYAKLEDYSRITDDDERFDVALGLVLTWVNRILFLKLLESQLVVFNNGRDVRFLDIEHIKDYDLLHDLFMKVMARPKSERPEELDTLFPDVPYLNSSLFELSSLEQDYFPIGGVRLGEIEVFNKTVLKDGNGRRVTGRKNALDYLFSFLAAYDFGTDKNQNDEAVRTGNDKLIDASVLGLIFEKINGYKDGSFFTPGYITEYICNKTLRRAVIDKFNKEKGWRCEDFEDLKEKIEYGQREVRNEANAIINSLRICDPAVGSGHFLVSALNELIAIKSELGILQDISAQPKRISEYDVRVEYDELVIADEDGDIFKYDPASPNSQRIQETLFEEKRVIIENCLFGVDLNPKSVEVCRLRLWIELLKNAYYYRNENGERVLQTLPNIDINIKCGNSLASMHPVCIGRKIAEMAGMKNLVREYKKNVRDYKNCHSKAIKSTLNNDILRIKNRLMPPVQLDVFGHNNQRIASAQEVYKHALEWMIEFPEVLNEEGTFEGFDVVVGNPPYISLETLRQDAAVYAEMHRIDETGNRAKAYNTLESRGDIYTLFVERGLNILRKGGLLSYILPNKWEKVMYGRPLRELFLQENLTHLIDFGDNQIFEDATTYTCIIRMKKERQDGKLLVSTIEKVNSEMLHENVEEEKEDFDTTQMNDGIWVISSLHNFNTIKRLRENLATLDDYTGGESYRGILSGLSEAFNINADLAHELISQDVCSKEIIRPFLQGRGLVAYDEAKAGSYLLFIPKGFTVEHMGIDRNIQEKPTESEAWTWFKANYPAISSWLERFKEKASKRTDKGDYWWELRACAYYNKFEEHKIFYQVFQTKPCFVYDESSTFCNNSMYFLNVPDKALLALLCSNIGWWLITEFCPPIQHGRQLIWDNLRQIPVPSSLPDNLIDLATQAEKATREKDDEKLDAVKRSIDKIIIDLYNLN